VTSSELGKSEALRAAREKRDELKQAVSLVEIAAASPAGEPGWHKRLGSALQVLGDALEHHVTEVEGDGGLLGQLAVDEPRLINQITQLRDEHPVLSSQVAKAAKTAADEAAADELRLVVLDTLFAIVGHRQRGADVVYEAYNVDIGGG